MRSLSEDFAFVNPGAVGVPGDCEQSAVPREEWQANRFAVALLIDALVLREEYEARFGAGPVVRSDRL